MTTPLPPPQPGQLNWAVPLNQYINTDAVIPAAQALGLINSHVSATDPHGDQAYARSLVNAITSTANQPNGFVQLNGSGKVPLNSVPSSALQANFYDVINDYGILPNTGADVSSAIQAVLNACAAAGGGEVWVGDGNFGLGSVLIIGSNTWLHLSPGCTFYRMNPIAGAAPAQMLCNVSFTSSAIPSGNNIKVSGGTWDATGGNTLTSACTPIMFVQVTFAKVAECAVYAVASNPAVEINGSKYVTIRDCWFTGAAITTSGNVPAVRFNSTTTGNMPSGLASGAYNNAVCQTCTVDSCIASANSYNRFAGSDLYNVSYQHNNVTVTNCNMAAGTYIANPPVDGVVIQQLNVFGNLFYGEGTLDLTTTGGSVFVGNSTSAGSPSPVAGAIAGTWEYATGIAGQYTVETWHTLPAPSIGSIGGYARYKLLADSGLVLVQVQDLVLPGTSPADGTVVWPAGTLPTTYRPSITLRLAAVANIEATEQVALEFETTGAIEIYGATTATRIDGSFLLSTL